jgi:hypothetical protein
MYFNGLRLTADIGFWEQDFYLPQNNLARLDASRIWIEYATLYIDLASLNTLPGSGLVITFGLVPTAPEPETYALMLAGLALIGVMARHRRSAWPARARVADN